MAKTRARSSEEAPTQQSSCPRVIDRKSSGWPNKVSTKPATKICKSTTKPQFQAKEPTRNVIDAPRSLRRAKAMAIVKTIELQMPRSRPRSITPNTIKIELVSSKQRRGGKVYTDQSHSSRKREESNKSPSTNESPSIRVTRSSISSANSSINEDNLSNVDINPKTSSKNNGIHVTISMKNVSTKDRRRPSSTLETSTPSGRHSRVASLNARAKVHLLYDDGYTNCKQQQQNISTSNSTRSSGKKEDPAEDIKTNIRKLRSLPVRSANNSIVHQLESSLKLQEEKEAIPTSIIQKNKRSSYDDIEIIDTKKCKRQANLNASAFMLATCTSDYIVSSNGPPPALLRQESALKNLKEKKKQQNAKTCNTSITPDPPKTVVINSIKKSEKISSTSSTLISRPNHSASEETSKMVGVRTYSRKGIGPPVKTGRNLEKNQEKKVTNRTLGSAYSRSISDTKDITLDEQNSTHSDLIIDPISRICDSIDASIHVPKATQVQINATEDVRSKGASPSNSSTIQVQEAIHSKEKHRIKVRQTNATTSQSYRVELQTTVSQPPSTFITSGHGTSAVFSNQASGTSSGGQNRKDKGQNFHRRAKDQVIQTTPKHIQNSLQIAPGASASSSRDYTGRGLVYNSSSTQIQNPCTLEASTSIGTNITSSLSRSLQNLQPQMHNLQRTFVDGPLNSNSIPMIDVANSSSSQLHQNAFIIPSVTPMQSPSSSVLSPSSSSPFFYGFYQNQNSSAQSQRASNQYSQPLIQANKQPKRAGWTETYLAHSQPSPEHMSSRNNLHIKASPVAGELFCDTNRSFDQFGNLYNQSYSTNDSSVIVADPSNLRSSMNDPNQSHYQNTLDRQQSNSSYYGYDNSGNQRGAGSSHMSRNSSKNSTYQISRPNPPASMNQSQAYQDSFMQTLGVPPLIGISEQPYLILYPRPNDVGFSVGTNPQNRLQDSYCNSHNLMMPSVTVSSPVRSVGNGSSLISNEPVRHEAASGNSEPSSKHGSNKLQGVNVTKKSSKSQVNPQHEQRRTNRQTPSSSPRANREVNKPTRKPPQPGSRVNEKTGLLAVAPFNDRIIEKTNSTLVSPIVTVASHIVASSSSSSSPSSSFNHLKTKDFPSSAKPHSGPSVTSPMSQNQQAITDTSNISNPSESSDPTTRKAQKKILKKRTLEGLWTLQGTPEDKFVNLTNESTIQKLLCYPAIKHIEGDIIKTKDSVLLRSGARKTDLPFIAKITNFWKDPNDGIMMSLLWYYRPEHTEEGRKPHHLPDELFASRHRDINSVACIEDKCYVLTFNEYCRYRKRLRMEQAGVTISPMDYFVASPLTNPRIDRIPKADVNPELVFCCRQIYDSKQKKIIKNPLINSKYGNH